MSYTFEDFHKDMAQEHVHLLPPEVRLRGLPPEKVLSYYQPEERLPGLTEDQIRAYLEQIQQSKNNV